MGTNVGYIQEERQTDIRHSLSKMIKPESYQAFCLTNKREIQDRNAEGYHEA